MSESNPNDENQNQSQQEPVDPPAPDPSSGPTSVAAAPVLRTTSAHQTPPVLQTLCTVGLNVIGGGVALIFAGAMLTPCVGATRSARLSQAQRRQEIADAILQMNAEEPHESASTGDADPPQ